jgi:hypothetical protein
VEHDGRHDLVKFRAPAGPAGIIVELAQRIG